MFKQSQFVIVVVLSALAATVVAQTQFTNCADVIAIPGNPSDVTDATCAVCNNGGSAHYPCDQAGLCYCRGSTIPPQYVLPFTYCTQAIAVTGNANGVTDTDCARCNNGAWRHYPCNEPFVLCTCAPGAGTITTQAPTAAPPTTPVPPPTPAPPTTSSPATQAAVTPVPPTPRPATAPPATTFPAQTPAPTVATVSPVTSAPATPRPATVAPTMSPPVTVAPVTPITVAPTTPRPTTTAPVTSAPSATPSPSSVPRPPLSNTIAGFAAESAPECLNLISAGSSAYSCGRSYAQVVCMSMAFYQAQKGGRVDQSTTIRVNPAWRGDCFVGDGAQLPSTSPIRNRNLTLGWFDAGDYVKFGLPMAYSAYALAWGALAYPAGYADPATQRALLYNLRVVGFYWLEGWDPVTKTLITQIGNGQADHAKWTPCKDPSRQSESRPVGVISASCPGTEVAGDTASALASIAMVLAKFEGSASLALQQRMALAAAQLWDFAYNGRRQSYTSCVPDAGSFYASYSGFNDELAMSSAWLHELQTTTTLLSGTAYSSTNFLAAAEAMVGTGQQLDWDNKHLGAALKLYELTKKATYASAVGARISAFMTGDRTAGGLIKIMRWGALRHAANAAFVARRAADIGINPTSASSYRQFAKRQLDYILGSNPAGRSYVVGFGTNPPLNPHHRSAHDSNDINTPRLNRHTIFGALVGGPFDSDTSYTDDRTDFVTSEVATDYNALFTSLAAAFASDPVSATDSPTCAASTAPIPVPPSPVQPSPPLSPPAPGVISGGSYTIGIEKLENWWLQVTVNPQPAGVAFVYNDGTAACIAEGPKWGAHWTCPPAPMVESNQAIDVLIFQPVGTVAQHTRVKEGSVAATVIIEADIESFDVDDFVGSVADALGVDASRINVTSVTVGSVRVDFEILPMPLIAYSGEGAARRAIYGGEAAQANFTNQTTTAIRQQLEAFAAAPSASAAAASSPLGAVLHSYGAAPSSLVVHAAPTGAPLWATPAPPPISDAGCSGIMCQIGPLVGGAVGGFIVAAIIVSLVMRRRRAAMNRFGAEFEEQPMHLNETPRRVGFTEL